MRRFLAALFAAGLVLGACGGGDGGPDPSEDPKGALTAAFENLGEYDGVDMTFRIDTDTSQLLAMSEGDLTDEQANMIVNSSINVKALAADDPAESEVEFVVDIDGSLIELRVVNNVAYVRADVSDLVEKFGGSQADVDAAAAQAGAQFDFVQPLIDGEWVGFEGAEQLQQQFGAPSPDAELQKELAADMAKAFEDSSTVTDEGSEDPGQHLVANVKIRDLYDSLVDVFGSIPSFPGAELPDASEVPDEEIAIDFWVDGGNLTQIGFDALQIARIEGEDIPEGLDKLGLLLEIEEFGGGIDEPDAATTVNLQELMGGLLGGLGGLGGTDTETGGGSELDPSDICETLKDSPPEVQAQFTEECPEFAQ